MKSLIICLTAFILCFGLTANAETPDGKGDQGSVTSTIRVRIPASASITLGENRSLNVSSKEIALATSARSKTGTANVQANKTWIINVDRMSGLLPAKPVSSQPAADRVIHVIYTATAQ